jgi:putative phosphonate metabolism protein
MTEYPRYAVYYAAERGSTLDRFGAQLLGYDAWSGERLPFPADVAKATPDWEEMTGEPRKYGFHATLKAPFALATGRAEAELAKACASFAAQPRALPVIKPAVDSISGFIAVLPAVPCDEIERLAADCLIAFDEFRAPLTEEDRGRRKPNRLTPRQREHLDRWGYPYVMEEYRFHMTLTGRLDEIRRAPVLQMLRERFAQVGIDDLTVDRIGLFRQNDAGGRFRIVGSWPLVRK